MFALVAGPLGAAELNCHGPSNVEDFHYSWRMRGGLSWVAGLVFPTSGVGELKTVFPSADHKSIDSELLITSTDRSGFYVYQTQMDERGQNTLMTYHGYAWKNKSRKEQTIFDYIKRLAHIHKETPDKTWDKTEPLPPDSEWWSLPNVIATPHVSNSSPQVQQRTLDLFLDNLRRWKAGEPLRNVVDLRAGY